MNKTFKQYLRENTEARVDSMSTEDAILTVLDSPSAEHSASTLHKAVIALNDDEIGSEERLAWRSQNDKKSVKKVADHLVKQGVLVREVKTQGRGANANLKGKVALYRRAE